MAYVSFTLKYRPQTFEQVIGQPHVSQTLRHAVAHDQVAHAYLFCGPRGTGKTTLARILAKALNCRSGPTPTPCSECDLCVAIRDGRALDVVEIDAASNRGIDEIRELRERVKYSPAESRCKVYILDEVHMLTNEAFNALLKTLEEPPAHTYFVLATTEPHKVPATILSRCQRFDFRRISVPDATARLDHIVGAEAVEAEPAALAAIARAADGAMRDAESILEQMVAYAEGPITTQMVNTVLGLTEAPLLADMADIVVHGDIEAACRTVDKAIAQGKDLSQLVADLTLYLRDLLRITLGAAEQDPTYDATRAAEQAAALGRERLVAAIRRLGEVQTEFRRSFQHGLLLEMALLELCAPPAEPPAEAPASAEPEPRSRPRRVPQATEAASAEEPAPEAAPTPPVSAGDLAAAQAAWERVKAYLNASGAVSVVALLREAEVTAVTDQQLSIAFNPKFAFHHGKVVKERALVEQAIQQVFGQPLRLEAVLSDEAAVAPRPTPPPQRLAVPATAEADPFAEPANEPEQGEQAPNAQQTDLLKQVLDVFPGSTVSASSPVAGSQPPT